MVCVNPKSVNLIKANIELETFPSDNMMTFNVPHILVAAEIKLHHLTL